MNPIDLGPAHQLWAEYKSQSKAAKALGITKKSFWERLQRERLRALGEGGSASAKPLSGQESAPSGGAEATPDKYDLILEALTSTIDPPRRDSAMKMVIEPTSNIVPVILWSDWHIGETVDPSQTFGYNIFNEKVAQERIKTLITKTLALARHESSSKNAVLWLGGDFVSGWLHEELVATDWCTPLQAVHWVCQKLYNGICDVLTEFSELTVICSPGNHGRLTHRPVAKQNAYTAYDWLIYSMLKSWFGNMSGLDFIIPAEGDNLISINKHPFFFTHGNNLGAKGGNGEIGVIGPIMRGRSRILNSMASMNMQFKTLVMGHVHQPIWMPNKGVIVNPALCGYDEYAKMNRYTAGPPSQLLFFVHHEFGPVLPIEVYL